MEDCKRNEMFIWYRETDRYEYCGKSSTASSDTLEMGTIA
jgi:hypothetical protein